MIIYDEPDGMIYLGNALDVLKSIPARSINCCVTSPPYWGLRDYGLPDQKWPDGWSGSLGLEPTPELFVEHIVEIFCEVRRVLRDDGTLWLNLGDSYATGAGSVGNCPGGGEQGRNWIKGAGINGIGPNTQPNRMPIEGLKPKDMVGIPWRVAFAMQADGWYLRQDIIWHKPNPMPESVKDRCTKAHEYIFLLSKNQRYFYDHEAIKERCTSDREDMAIKAYMNGNKDNHKKPSGWDTGKGSHGNFHKNGRSGTAYSFSRKTNIKGKPGMPDQHRPERENIEYFGTRNKRSVWTIATKPFSGAHFATFPPTLIEPCILAGCPKGGTVLDPFFGAGTTGIVAYRNDRKFIGIELSEQYLKEIAIPRIKHETQQLKLFN